MDFRKIRINQYIRAREVRVVDESGNYLGVMSPQDALKKAQDQGLDLIEIAPLSNPPVCKIMDFSKFKYLTEKKEKEQRKSQRTHDLKEIHIRPVISDHDLQVKLNHINDFFKHGYGTKIIIRFMGREQEFMQENSVKLLEKINLGISENGVIEKKLVDKNKITLLVLPKKK
ncbi:MAG: translation initiation factor IF-3 [Endomicrobiia bacterium]